MILEFAKTNLTLFWTLFAIVYIVIVEVIYILAIKSKDCAKPKTESWGIHSIKIKFMSLFYGLFGLLITLVIVENLTDVIIYLGVIALVVIYFWINYLIAKEINNVKGKKRTKK